MKKSKSILGVNWLFVTIYLLLVFSSCQKNTREDMKAEETVVAQNEEAGRGGHGNLQPAKAYSSEVAIRWLNMQLDMLRVPLPAGTTSEASERCLAYCGIALYESVVPGMQDYRSLGKQLNQFPKMPAIETGKSYHWAASANAALAYVNRNLFPNTAAANKTAMDNLESELQSQYAAQVSASTLQRSIAFGRSIGEAVFNWLKTDGTATMPLPATYILPIGPGLWEKTPPNFAGPVNPFASMRRYIVTGSNNGARPAPPPSYSTVPGSKFYKMAKDVYDKSLTLTPDQTAAALYHRDAPGYPGGGTLVAMLAQIFQQTGCNLAKAAEAYAKVGIGTYDAITYCFTLKYSINQLRPITYIQNTMGKTTWAALFPTPGHPEFPAAHPTNGGMLLVMLSDVFGERLNFTFHHYDYLGLPARSYRSLRELAVEMSDSRVWAGVHYQASVDKGLALGKKVASNILKKIEFKRNDRHDSHGHHSWN